MTSLKDLHDKLYSDAMSIVGKNDITVCKLVTVGCDTFLSFYADHTYKESYDAAWEYMLIHYNRYFKDQ